MVGNILHLKVLWMNSRYFKIYVIFFKSFMCKDMDIVLMNEDQEIQLDTIYSWDA